MEISELFWLFFIFVAVQPMIQQKVREFYRMRLIAKIQKQRKSRVILLVHRQEQMSLLGIPLFRYIDINDSEEVLRAVHMTGPEVPLELVLHTPGGMVLASLQIARALSNHQGKVTVVVPHFAMSGGTLIALAADEILMCEEAVLGPVDPQLGTLPAASVLKVVQQKPVEKIDDETLIKADQAEKAVAQLYEAVKELLAEKHPPEKAEELARLLSHGKWTHDYPITFQQARELGMKVNSDVPEEYLKLLRLYRQPVRRRQGVEYLPEPYRGDRPGREHE